MKRNAFTLIELVATVAILTIIFAFTMPKLIGIINDNEEKNRNIIIEKVIAAAKDYVVEYDKIFMSNFTNVGDASDIPISSLLNVGLIDDSDVLELGSDAQVHVVLSNNDVLVYSIITE